MFSSAHELRRDIVQPSPWSLTAIAGRFIEISTSANAASLTLAFGLVREAQKQGEPVGWVTSTGSFFYPPDAAQGGIDLAALVVIRVLHAGKHPYRGRKTFALGRLRLDRARSRNCRYSYAAPKPLDRARPTPSRGLGLPYRKGEQDIFAGIAGFTAGSCRAATEFR